MGEVSELLVARMHSEERAKEFHRLQKLNQRWQREWRSVRTAYIRLARRMQHEQGEMWEEVVTLFHFLEENQRYLQETQRQLAHLSRELTQYNAQLTMLTEQLQDDISGMRLVPFDTLVNSFQRLIRDLARDVTKEVHLTVDGAMVEMDKTALDALKEPSCTCCGTRSITVSKHRRSAHSRASYRLARCRFLSSSAARKL